MEAIDENWYNNIINGFDNRDLETKGFIYFINESKFI